MLKEHKPIHDPAVNEYILQCLSSLDHRELSLASWSADAHIEIFAYWIQQSRHRQIIGLQDFSYRALCSGTSQAIETYINRNQNRRIRFSKNEFVLSRIICNANSITWQWLEDEDIHQNDAIIVSWPFSGNGGHFVDLNRTIADCQRLSVPVMIDAAYFGISTGLTIDVSTPCITDVCVSISKPFSTMLRHGIRFTRSCHDDLLQNSSDMGILSRPGVVTGSKILKRFDADYIVDKYLLKYENVCTKHSLIETPTITLALGQPNTYPEFTRGDIVRICVTDEILQ